MKKNLLTAIAIITIFCCNAAEIRVSPQGKSLHQAVREARNLRRTGKIDKNESVRIILQNGVYNLYEPLIIRPEDSGSESSPTIFEAESDQAIISGGVKISDWKRAGKFWVANVPDFNGNRLNFRQMWINGRKAVRARDVNDFDKMNRILANDKVNETLWVPAAAVRNIAKSPRAEMVLHQMWAISVLRIKSITFKGDSAGVQFHNPEARIQFERPWPQPMIKTGLNSAFYLTNAISLLDERGEWFFDSDNSKLYYYPLENEDMRSAEVLVPAISTLLNIEGTAENPVQYVYFRRLKFEHSTWLRPSEQGHVPLQSGMYLLDGYKLRPAGVPGNENPGIENQAWVGRPDAAVKLANTQHITFDNCYFEHLGSCGLDIVSGSKFTTVENSVFQDIAGNGLQIGSFANSSLESHLPYDPADERSLCSHQTIRNNLITNVTNEDWGCVGIAAGYVRNINIEHNEISEISYSGISLGWGWTKTVNTMRNNRVHANYIHHYARHCYDVAGIYTLSAQSKSEITENRIDSIYHPSYAHDPNHWFYLYTDEGSSFITVKNNWCAGEKFLKNSNGPGNTWENNGEMVDEKIKNKAGRYVYVAK